MLCTVVVPLYLGFMLVKQFQIPDIDTVVMWMGSKIEHNGLPVSNNSCIKKTEDILK